MRQDLSEFGAGLLGGGEITLGFVVDAVFFGECALVGKTVGAVLGECFIVEVFGVIRFAFEFPVGKFGIDAAQGDLFAEVVGVDGFAVGIGQGGVEPHEDLSGFDLFAL